MLGRADLAALLQSRDGCCSGSFKLLTQHQLTAADMHRCLFSYLALLLYSCAPCLPICCGLAAAVDPAGAAAECWAPTSIDLACC
jgi:hypothetical protein